MPKYLGIGSYTVSGLNGLKEEGAVNRREATKKAIESLGGTLEAYYFAFGENDFYVLADLPDNATVAGNMIQIGSSGAVKGKTIVLLTPEEVDEGLKKNAQYRPPGE